MALECQQGVIADHAAAIVRDLYELFSASFNLNSDSRGTGIQRIFEQFLHHGRWPLDDFSGSDLVGDVLGKDVNAAHGS